MKENQLMVAPPQSSIQRKVFLKIGRPGYRVTKVRDRDTGKEGMMVQVHLPQIKPDVIPRRRFMSAWEQKREPPNKNYQYLIVREHSSRSTHSSYIFFRLPLSLTKPSLSEFPHGRLRMSPTTLDTGTGHIGILIPSNTASSSCSGLNIEDELHILSESMLHSPCIFSCFHAENMKAFVCYAP
jgi:hypothetical protein